MGIKGLGKLIKDNCPNSYQTASPKDLEGTKICIDTSYYLCSRYKAALSHIAETSNVVDENAINVLIKTPNKCTECDSYYNKSKLLIPIIFDLDEVKRYWYQLLNLFIEGCKKYGISLIWVLDGKSPEAKKSEHKKRSESRKKQKDKSYDSIKDLIKLIEDSNSTELSKEVKDMIIKVRCKIGYSILPSIDEFEEIIEYLCNLGQCIYQAPSEGETTCAKLVIDERADYPFTKDTDILLFGCDKVITKISFAKNKEIVEYIVLSEILEGLNIDRAQLVDLSILLGCDYNDGIEGIGPKIAVDIIKRYKSLENAENNVINGKIKVSWGKSTKLIPFNISTLNLKDCYTQFILPDKRLARPKKGIPTEDISRFNTVPVQLSIIKSLLNLPLLN